MRIKPEASGATIVLVGSFNPRIFRPEWFESCGIIGSQEAAAASIQIIHEQIAAFSLDWLNFNVTPDQLTAETTSPPLVRVSDLIVNTFKEFLPHTPVYQMGINRVAHFRVESFDVRDKIGNILAPQAAWGEWTQQIAGNPNNVEQRGGLTRLSMRQLDRRDSYVGQINATVEPSTKFPIDGIYVTVNDHYELGNGDDLSGANKAVEILQSEWENSIRRSEWIIDQVMALQDRVRNG